MSDGKDRYDERRRLQAENDVMRERRENSRLKREEEGEELLRSLHAFMTGKRGLLIARDGMGNFTVRIAADE